MKKIFTLLFVSSFFASNAQNIFLNSGTIETKKDIATIEMSNWQNVQFNQRTYVLLQFEKSTSLNERNAIEAATGIRFFDYLPTNTFITSLPSNININLLQGYFIKTILPYQSAYKIEPSLLQESLPSWIFVKENTIKLIVDIHEDVDKNLAENYLIQQNIKVTNWQSNTQAEIELNKNNISLLAQLPFVKYIEYTSEPAVLENVEGRSSHRTNVIDSEYFGGKHYNGDSVSVAMGDDGTVGPHIDFQGRLVDLTTSNGGAHADHVIGIVGGAGNFNPNGKGNAAGAKLVAYNGYENLNNATAHYNLHGIRITTNSLGQGCNAGYNNDARTQDQLINSRPSLISVHSSGNSGTSSCGGVANYKNITGGYKAAKNCIAVGNLRKDDVIAGSSSRGPAKDGRIKPEVCAVGTDVFSTQPNNTYDNLTGTSMACPATSGTLATLWEAYRKLNANQDPRSSLMKNVLMNSADDLGNAGPDFQYGYGRINARRALEILENNQYLIDSVDNAQSKTHVIAVPSGVSVVKFMVYWHDRPAAANAAKPLINNINMTVTNPAATVYNPWVLDHTPNVAALSSLAVREIDSTNNTEQVTLKNPPSGNYVVSVNGFNIPQGPQLYTLTYSFVMNGVTMTYPQGGESFVPGITERIRWDASESGALFTLEYSENAGTSWTLISDVIPANQKFLDWTPPAGLSTGQMKMKISRAAQSDESDTLFSVYRVPTGLTVDTACNQVFHLKWNAVPGANKYTVYSLGAKYMDSIASSTTTDVYLTGYSPFTPYYFAISANDTTIPNGAKGRRSIAIFKGSGEIGCVDDVENVSTTLPYYSKYSCDLSLNVPVTMKIKNVGLRDVNSVPVRYRVNNGPIISETSATLIPIGDSINYTFATLANILGGGTFTIQTWCELGSDPIEYNDSSFAILNVVAPGNATAPLIQDFDGPIFPPLGWTVINPDNNVKWQKTLVLNGANPGNTHTAYMDFFNYITTRQIDILESPQIDLTTVTTDSVILSFDVAYARRPLNSDTLSVKISNDCADNFSIPYKKWGSNLETVLSSNTSFSPISTSEWRNEQLDLTAYKGEKVIIQFEGANDRGNNLFLDNINIQLKNAISLSTKNYEDEKYKIYPNPSNGNYILSINSLTSHNIQYSIQTITGTILKRQQFNVTPGELLTAINIQEFANGVYILQLKDGKNVKNIKLLKQ